MLHQSYTNQIFIRTDLDKHFDDLLKIETALLINWDCVKSINIDFWQCGIDLLQGGLDFRQVDLDFRQGGLDSSTISPVLGWYLFTTLIVGSSI